MEAMTTAIFPPTSRMARAWLRLRGRRAALPALADLPTIPMPAQALRILSGPAAFRSLLLDRIASARERIILVALYLQDDPSGREIMDALYAAHRKRPDLVIQVLVDQHRAQRGLIGKAKSPGNAAMYQHYAARFGPGVQVLGVPVQTRELFGVLHLKGFIIDGCVLYSGASLNDLYLAREERYRLDRYHLLESRRLADTMAELVGRVLLASPALRRLDQPRDAGRSPQGAVIRSFRRNLRLARYTFAGAPRPTGAIAVTPLIGFGANNELNATLLALLGSAQQRLLIYTPYFNLPGPVRRVLTRQLAKGRIVTLVVGDKVASDFFMPPHEPFKVIGLLPYLYEANLRRFARTHRAAIADGRLNIHLWRHADNSFHAKGMFIDDGLAVLTGNNLNPRAWTLDLENGLVIQDPEGLLSGAWRQEQTELLAHTTRLEDFRDLETPTAYPLPVRKALKRLSATTLDRLLFRLL